MKMKMFKPQSSTVNQPFFPTHEIHIKAKVKVLSALSFCHSHSISVSRSPSNTFLLSSFFINLYWAHFVISIFYLHRAKYFCLHSQGKYFHSSVLTNIFVPGISLRDSVWQESVQTKMWPGPECRPEWGTAWRKPGVRWRSWSQRRTLMMVYCAGPGIKLGCFEDKYRDYEFSFDPSNGNCVWLCCYYKGRDTLLWYFQDYYSAYQSYEIGANICPVSWYMWPTISLQ